MKVFLNTNVLVSGFSLRGLCADVIRLVLAEHEFITGEVVLQEVQRVLKNKLRFPDQLLNDILNFLNSQTVYPKPQSKPSISLRDKEDLLILASALEADADVLVTGDKDLLEFSDRIPSLLIKDPRGLWDLAKKRSKK